MTSPVPPEHVRAIIDLEFGTRVSALAPVGSGEISDSWYVTAGGVEYVLRVSRPGLQETLHKDRYAVTTLADQALPLPTFVRVADLGERSYAITTRSPGVPLDTLPPDDYRALLPELVTILDAIHGSDISATTGWGYFDAKGRGAFPSWPGLLRSVVEETEGDRGFYGRWHRLFEESFLDRKLYDAIYAEMLPLLDYCPAERYLVHADYGFNNVLAHDGRITAVLDWANAMFGDFLFDVAWLALGHPEVDYVTLFSEFYRARGREIPHYHERLRCYSCYIALDGLRFYAQTNQPEAYAWYKGRIDKELGLQG